MKSSRPIVIWLGVVALLVFTMIVVGGVTRLTESGLSMVDWRPIMGALPPMTETEWNETFEAYKAYPQYQSVNRSMDLAGFKQIFFWEYFHRLLGRLIGVAFAIPFFYFLATRAVPKRWVPHLTIALFLGGLQGVLGWYMVKSGLIDIPRVSHYRLAAHLLLAMFILAYLVWIMFGMMQLKRISVTKGFRAAVYFLGCLTFLQLLYGAFTAGIRAGYGYNTFPLMGDKLIADAVFFMEPFWVNFFESSATIQFVHRVLGTLLLVSAISLWVLGRTYGSSLKWAAAGTSAAILVQFTLGVLTLIHVVPIGLASLHQAFACVVIVSLVYLTFVASGDHTPKTG